MPEPEITVASVNEKLAKNESLSSEETKFVMSLPPDGTDPGPEEKDIDWEAAQDLDGGEKKTETPVIKKEEKPAEKPAEKPEDPKLDMERIEVELAKPEGQESLTEFTKREKAYFYQMRRDRRARQKAEEDRDAALFREAKLKKDGVKPEVPDLDPMAELDKKDPTDFLTVGEVRKLLAKPAKKADEPVSRTADPVRVKYLQMCDQEARSQHPEDYDAVMELTEDILNHNSEYLVEMGEAINKGENPAEKAYQLIKQDKEFSQLFPAAQMKADAKKKSKEKPPEKSKEELEKERKAKEAQDALEKNKDKTKTTGHAEPEGSGKEADADKIEGYSVNDIMKMSDLSFAKLPKKVRQTFLEKYG